MERHYPVSSPSIHGNEKAYVLDCLDSSWISSKGKYIERFERQLAEFCGTKHAIACSSGTTALHLALLAHGIGSGDEVIVPALTFIATANAVVYTGATPVFIDVEADTWNLNPDLLESLITPRTKGIIPVHLYGHPANMDPILDIAKRHGIFVIEDAAEAIGAKYKGKMAGSLGNCAIFSFFGNKIITTGEGGAITTSDDDIASRARLLREQGADPTKRYWYPVIGYNYRMTNLQAAIGCAQLENIDWHIEQRLRVAREYMFHLEQIADLCLPIEKEWAKNVYWMFSVLFHNQCESFRDDIMRQLCAQGVETRPFFYPLHTLPPYKACVSDCPVAEKMAACGINVPTFAGLTSLDIEFICHALKDSFATAKSHASHE